MLKFRPVHADDYDIAAPIMKATGYNSTESSFVILHTWSGLYNGEICIDGETVFIRSLGRRGMSYLPPLGGDMKSALLKIAETQDGEIRFHSVTDKMREKLEEAFPGEFEYEERRDSFDYIYLRDELASLAGKKFHQKRNHVNKFLKRYEGRFEYNNMTQADIADVLEFQSKWISMASEKEGQEALRYETTAIEKLLYHFESFSLRGGVLRVDGNVCAYCVGAKISDNTVDVMVEKGDYAYDGVYQAINKMFAENNCADVIYINREEDMGIEGMRRAKLSYCPAELLRKYGAVWKRK
ncbi:MAG: DUF2156 domain-containing protein [Oscillospiraceae bacterium]|nr:DUF2156 domain-containing protein [Oscillospiraceae bacterium]